MPILQQCCWAYPLKKGCSIIAGFNLIVCISAFGTTSVRFIIARPVKDVHISVDGFNKLVQSGIEKQITNRSETVHHDIGLKDTVDKSTSKGEDQGTKTLLTVTLVFYVMIAICNLLLLFGANQENGFLLLTWLVVETAVVIALTITIIIGFAVGGFGSTTNLLVYYSIELGSLLPHPYFALVVYSYYQTLRENSS